MARNDDLIEKNFPEGDERRVHGMRVLSLFAVIAVVIFAAAIGYFYLSGNKNADPNHLPLIAETAPPEKTRPADPGGMDIPHQDTTVYDQLNPKQGDAADNQPEKLLPAPEVPMTPAAANSPPDPTTPQTTPANIPNALPTLPGAPADVPKTDAAPAAEQPAVLNKAEEKASDVKAELPSSNPQVNSPANFRIQLGAVRDQAAADSEWARMQKKYADALKGLDVHFAAVNLGDKGTFLRIQTGPLTQTDAEARCEKLKAQNQACLIVKAAP